MAQTIWIPKLPDAKKAEADGPDYICEHQFRALGAECQAYEGKGLEPVAERQR